MWRSPHKRGTRRSLRVKDYKTTVSGNKGGNSHRTAGARVSVYPDPRDRRLRGASSKRVVVTPVAIQPPGYPSGKCLGAGHERVCRCGTHNRRAA